MIISEAEQRKYRASSECVLRVDLAFQLAFAKRHFPMRLEDCSVPSSASAASTRQKRPVHQSKCRLSDSTFAPRWPDFRPIEVLRMVNTRTSKGFQSPFAEAMSLDTQRNSIELQTSSLKFYHLLWVVAVIGIVIAPTAANGHREKHISSR